MYVLNIWLFKWQSRSGLSSKLGFVNVISFASLRQKFEPPRIPKKSVRLGCLEGEMEESKKGHQQENYDTFHCFGSFHEMD